MKRVVKDDGIVIISLLKLSKLFEDIVKNIEEIFIIFKKIDEGKDIIFFCKKGFK